MKKTENLMGKWHKKTFREENAGYKLLSMMYYYFPHFSSSCRLCSLHFFRHYTVLSPRYFPLLFWRLAFVRCWLRYYCCLVFYNVRLHSYQKHPFEVGFSFSTEMSKYENRLRWCMALKFIIVCFKLVGNCSIFRVEGVTQQITERGFSFSNCNLIRDIKKFLLESHPRLRNCSCFVWNFLYF